MKIFYIGFYSDLNNNRKNAPSADTKMDYIIEALKEDYKDIELLSFCPADNRNVIFKKYDGYIKEKNGIKIKYFTSYASRFRFIRVICRFFSWLEQKRYIRKNCISNDSIIIIYHSLVLLKVYKLLNKAKKKYIIEIEEIYSDVINKKRLRNKEINYLQNGYKYIFPTKLLNNVINHKNKPYIIAHGTYKIEKEMEKLEFDKNKVHCVYAGTFDPRKGGATAVAAAEYLPDNYHIHILGFGTETEVENMRGKIEKINKKSKAIVSYEGILTGEDYIKFIQSCDIGLSTQNSNASFNATSFPSKILSYMANGLRVVSVRIPAIETSKVGKYIYYYDNQNPQEIANAIMRVNINDNYDSKGFIKELDDEFKKELSEMLND